MRKTRIKIGVIGYLPFDFDREFFKNWKSDVLEIDDQIEDYHFSNTDSDTFSWGYSDEILNEELPENFESDFFIGITYVPIQDNYYARRLKNNRVVLSYFEMYKILKQENIPVENLLLRVLYAYFLVYHRNLRQVPPQNEWLGFTHDDTRGCIFDMNGNKSDVIFSLDRPQICDACTIKIRSEKVSDNCINAVKKEIIKIKKGRYYKIVEFIRNKPLLSIGISVISGILLNVLASGLYDLLKR